MSKVESTICHSVLPYDSKKRMNRLKKDDKKLRNKQQTYRDHIQFRVVGFYVLSFFFWTFTLVFFMTENNLYSIFVFRGAGWILELLFW